MKKYIALLTIILTIILTACSSQAKLDQETKCDLTGGHWKEFASSCGDTCSFERGETDVCAQVLTESCECGTGMCWNGESCVES